MYQVGDKVVYPAHGAGEVVAIEQREVAGLLRDYYILRLSFSGLTLAVPLDAAVRLGLRGLITPEEAGRVLQILSGQVVGSALPQKWNRRSRLLVDRIKAGDACELAAVLRPLAERERARELATGERRLFEQARDILLSELRLVQVDGEMAVQLAHVIRDLEAL